MELRSTAVDRVLEALSPSLAAEIERIVDETRQNLEVEFQKRIKDAVRDAELAVQQMAEVQLDRALAETRDSVRQQVASELQAKYKKELEDATGEIKLSFEDELKQASVSWNSEREKLQERIREAQVLSDAQRQMGDATSQAEILARFLKLSEPFATSIALYVAKADSLALWKSRGQAAFPEIVSQQTTDEESFFKLIGVSGKTVAGVRAAQPYRVDALEFLCASMERAIEMFGLRLRASASTPKMPEKPAVVAQPVVVQPVAAQPTLTEDEEKLHTEARKTARLLISEIKLYHEQEVQEGRAHSDLYRRLRREIDQGREMYNQRVPSALSSRQDYFHEELVRILTENDPSRLGDAYPGPRI